MQVKLVLKRNRLYVESPEKAILLELLQHEVIAAAHAAAGGAGIAAGAGRKDAAAAAMASEMQTIDLAAANGALLRVTSHLLLRDIAFTLSRYLLCKC